jgi:glycosyltransferase involved in cell wall biosynthesis
MSSTTPIIARLTPSLAVTAKVYDLVIVMPVYEDREAAGQLFRELYAQYGTSIFVVAVDDGSLRNPINAEHLDEIGLPGAVIHLRRNVGHQRAISIGLHYVADNFPTTSRTVVMDSDGEDLPSTIPQLIAPLESDEVDAVVAQRKSRMETMRFKLFYVLYKLLFRLLTGRKINFGNFVALKPTAVRRLTSMQELWTHLAGCVLLSKLRTQAESIDRGPRYAGKSKMNFTGLALHGFRAVMIFAEDVLVRVGIVSALVAVLSITAGLIATVLKVIGFATPGWFSVSIGILLIVFLQTGALTLVALMLGGVMRGGAESPQQYRNYIDQISYTKSL